jgi:hypothetical protein
MKESEKGSTKDKARAIGMLRRERAPTYHTIDECTFRAGECPYYSDTELVSRYRLL